MPQDIYHLGKYAKYLSASSAHMIEYKGVIYPTVEHAYHCQRYTDPKIIEIMKSARSPQKAWEASQQYKSKQVPDWDSKKILIMEDLCKTKLTQHEDVKNALLASGDDLILKDYPDSFWGIGLDGGRNEMGKIWMRLRDEL